MTTGVVLPSSSVRELLVRDPVVANTSMPLAGTEYSYVLPLNTRRFMLRSRRSAQLNIAYLSGQTGTTYFTVLPGCVYGEADLANGTNTIYFQSSVANDVLEILSWR